MDKQIEGEIIAIDHSEYWGMEFGTVLCPECQTEIQIGAMVVNTLCECGYSWSIETRAVGTKTAAPNEETA